MQRALEIQERNEQRAKLEKLSHTQQQEIVFAAYAFLQEINLKAYVDFLLDYSWHQSEIGEVPESQPYNIHAQIVNLKNVVGKYI